MSTYYDKNKLRWVFDFDKVIKGHRVRATKTLPKGWNRSEAEAYGRAEEKRLHLIATGAAEERVLITAAVTLYIKEQCPRLKNGDGVIKELARVFWAYDGKYMDELAEVARDYKSEATRQIKDENGNLITVPLAPASIKNKLSYLRAACRYAQKHHNLAKKTDLSIVMPVVRNERQHYASRGEMISLARACTDRRARAMIRLAFYTGMRLGEMMDLGRGSKVLNDVFLLKNTKNGEQRLVPKHPRVNVLCRYLPISCSKIWIQRLFERARKRAGLDHLHFHDLRHSAASELINSGVALHTVGKFLGHKDMKSTERYSHLSIESLAAAVNKIGRSNVVKSPDTKEKSPD